MVMSAVGLLLLLPQGPKEAVVGLTQGCCFRGLSRGPWLGNAGKVMHPDNWRQLREQVICCLLPVPTAESKCTSCIYAPCQASQAAESGMCNI